MRLNLGCGKDYREGWVNIDLWAEKVDFRCDIRKRLPFDACAFEEIYASGVFCEIGPNEEFRDALNECHRVLAPGGKITIIVPDAAYPIAFRDPFCIRYFVQETWNYLNSENFYYKQYGKDYGFLPWRLASLETNQNHIMTAVLEKVS